MKRLEAPPAVRHRCRDCIYADPAKPELQCPKRGPFRDRDKPRFCRAFRDRQVTKLEAFSSSSMGDVTAVTEKCPKCGSSEVLPKAKGTFEYAGLICMECGHVWPGPWPKRPRIVIKGWRTPDGRKIRG